MRSRPDFDLMLHHLHCDVDTLWRWALISYIDASAFARPDFGKCDEGNLLELMLLGCRLAGVNSVYSHILS